MLRQWLCAFSFCLHISFQPAKNKSSLGSKIIPMYSSVTFQLQQFSARDACHMQFFLSFHLAVRHYIVHRKQRSFDELTRHGIDDHSWLICLILLPGRLTKRGVQRNASSLYYVFLVIVIVKGAFDCLYDTSAMNFIPEEQLYYFLILSCLYFHAFHPLPFSNI